jgi:DNA-binding NtrC family response regulator
MPRSNIRTVCREEHECYLLIVDDDKHVLSYLLGLFNEETGIKPLSAGSIREALEIIHKTDNIEVILLDFRLPDSEGMETLRTVRDAVQGRIAIIGVSGSHYLEDEAFENGVIDFFAKPLMQIDVIARTKYAILNQRKINHHVDMCREKDEQLAILQSHIPEGSEAIKELEQIRIEFKEDASAFIQRAN